MQNLPHDDEKLQKVKNRVGKIRSFYMSLITFVCVNLLLLIINLVSSPHNLWFYWVTIIWGAVLILQAINTFTIRDRFLGDEWEERKTKELLEKDKKESK